MTEVGWSLSVWWESCSLSLGHLPAGLPQRQGRDGRLYLLGKDDLLVSLAKIAHCGATPLTKAIDPTSYSYSFGLFSQANRALQAAMKISLRIDDQGYLSLQMMMPTPAGKRLTGSDCGIIEFKLRALEDED